MLSLVVRLLFLFVLMQIKKIKSEEDYSYKLFNVLSDVEQLRLPLKNDTLCEYHMQLYIDNLLNSTPWAVKMFHSSAKLPNTFFIQDTLNLGDFDSCVDIEVLSRGFRGQHCVSAFIDSTKSNITDVAHNEDILSLNGIPHYYWSNCIPSTCKPSEWEQHLNNVLITNNISNVQAKTSSYYCHVKGTIVLDAANWTGMLIIAFIIVMVFLSTVYDVCHKKSVYRSQLLVSFSVLHNCKLLFITTDKRDSLKVLNGVRSLSTLWIIIGHHYYLYIFMLPQIIYNKTFLQYYGKSFLVTLAWCFFLSVDTFFLLSGTVLSYNFLVKMRNKNVNEFNIKKFYLRRYLRLTPAYAIVIVSVMSLDSVIGVGPLWKLNYENESNMCKTYWWSGLLYIQNYVNVGEMCIYHTWQLSADTQFYLVSPVFLISLLKKPRATVWCLLSIVIYGTVQNITIMYKNPFSPCLIEFSNLNVTYFPTHTRLSSWIVGLLLGYALYYKNYVMALKPRKRVMVALILLSTAFIIWPIYMEHNHRQVSYKYNIWECSIFYGLYRTVWVFGVSGMILVCSLGYGGPVNYILSLRGWLPISKLSYCIYLVHPLLIGLKLYRARSSHFMDNIQIISDASVCFGISLIFATLLHLGVESPVLILVSQLLR